MQCMCLDVSLSCSEDSRRTCLLSSLMEYQLQENSFYAAHRILSKSEQQMQKYNIISSLYFNET